MLNAVDIISCWMMRKEVIRTDKAAPPASTYSQGIKAGGFIFAGGPPLDSKGYVVKGDFKAQVKASFENAKAVLEAGGSSLDNVVRIDVYLRDFENFKDFDEVYRSYIKPPYPIRCICQPARMVHNRPLGMVLTAVVNE